MPVRRVLPGGGRLHIDRALPFLCVYRERAATRVGHTAQLVIGEAAHLIVPGSDELQDGVCALVAGIASVMIEQFDAFLLLEVWTADKPQVRTGEKTVPVPTFRIIAPMLDQDDATVRQLHKALSAIPLRPPPLDVEVVPDAEPAPPSLPPLVPHCTVPATTTARADAEKSDMRRSAAIAGLHYVGIEVQPVYRQARTGTPYPVLFETLQRGLSLALRQSAYHFAMLHTGHEPTHYHALGRRTAVRAASAADEGLTEISRSFDFLLQVTPVNAERAREVFDRHGGQRAPEFDYRPLIVDVPLLKRRLYNLPLDRLEDPTIAHLLAASRDELDRKLTMLADRNTPRFRFGSQCVYGVVPDSLLNVALELLSACPANRTHETGEHEAAPRASVDAVAFAQMAEDELALYRKHFADLSASVHIRDDVAGVLVSNGDLLISRQFSATPLRAIALLQHEIGTHVISYSNGLAQPLGQLATGLAGYEETQEGLAVTAEFLSGALTASRVRVLSARVVAAHALVDGATFVECHRRLTRDFGFGSGTAFTICMRIYRSGGLTKDLIYLRGLIDVLAYLRDGHDLEPLLLGKISLADVPAIEELRWREYLRPPRLTPRFLTNPGAADAMMRLRRASSIHDLLTGTLQ